MIKNNNLSYLFIFINAVLRRNICIVVKMLNILHIVVYNVLYTWINKMFIREKIHMKITFSYDFFYYISISVKKKNVSYLYDNNINIQKVYCIVYVYYQISLAID